jgi:hypothetical protein
MCDQSLVLIIGIAVITTSIGIGGKIIFDWLRNGKHWKNAEALDFKTFSIFKNGFETRLCDFNTRLESIEARIVKLEEKINDIYKVLLEVKK